MTKFISIFFLFFNILSKEIKVILKVQKVIKNNKNKEDLKDIFVKKIKITEDKITRPNYKPVDLLNFFRSGSWCASCKKLFILNF